jgi:hypothetical protein
MWSNWLNELWDAGENFYKSFNKAPNCLKANRFTISQFEFITEISPIGSDIKNADSGKLASSYKETKLKELELKGFCILSFEIDDSIDNKCFWLEYQQKSERIVISKEEDSEQVLAINYYSS